MPVVPKKSSGAFAKALPPPFAGLDLNFCRNPRCQSFGVPPRITSAAQPKTAGANSPSGTVEGDGKEAVYLRCGACGAKSVVKNNRAIAVEYHRLAKLRRGNPVVHGCRDETCESHGIAIDREPSRYMRYGRTKGGDQRFACRSCRSTFSIGKPARRHKRSEVNGRVLRLLVNGMPLSKIVEVLGVSFRDLYGKIDFLHRQVRAFCAAREGMLADIDWDRVGARMATDMQTLTLNWPTKRTRAAVAVNHLCTAHCRTGFIVAASLQFDPLADMGDVERAMTAVGDFARPRCFRRHGRLWSMSEFEDYLDRITLHHVYDPTEAPDVEAGLQLPHVGGLVRQDVMQFAHALVIRRMLRRCVRRPVLICDGDPGLAAAFVAAFADRIRVGTADVLTVSFNKGMSNDRRNHAVADGREALCAALGLTKDELDALPAAAFEDHIDALVAEDLRAAAAATPLHIHLADGVSWRFHTKSEPSKVIAYVSAQPGVDVARAARLLRLSTLRSVDAYFHKVRSNLRAATRASATPSGGWRRWDRYYFYRPDILAKVVEIYRFHHNWMGDRKTKRTPAMKIGLARGKIYERDLLSFL